MVSPGVPPGEIFCAISCPDHQQFGRSKPMHFAISASCGPTDPTRAMLPFIFAASAAQAGDRVTLMLFHDAVLTAVEGAGAKLVPVGPPNRYEEVAGHKNVTLWACKPCVEARGLVSLDKRIKLGGMNEFHAAAKEADTRVVCF
jgi:sulfur relay (sulfurtransferase) complex TusBCD TusD component (DsrE family)